MQKQVNYAEGIFVGYRYYDARKMDVLFPFGYGLSYTEFSYSNLKIDKSRITAKDTLMVSLDVTNTGSMEGKEIVQLYVSDKTHSASRPVRELKNFAAVTLKPGETKTVSMKLDSGHLHGTIQRRKTGMQQAELTKSALENRPEIL